MITSRQPIDENYRLERNTHPIVRRTPENLKIKNFSETPKTCHIKPIGSKLELVKNIRWQFSEISLVTAAKSIAELVKNKSPENHLKSSLQASSNSSLLALQLPESTVSNKRKNATSRKAARS